MIMRAGAYLRDETDDGKHLRASGRKQKTYSIFAEKIPPVWLKETLASFVRTCLFLMLTGIASAAAAQGSAPAVCHDDELDDKLPIVVDELELMMLCADRSNHKLAQLSCVDHQEEFNALRTKACSGEATPEEETRFVRIYRASGSPLQARLGRLRDALPRVTSTSDAVTPLTSEMVAEGAVSLSAAVYLAQGVGSFLFDRAQAEAADFAVEAFFDKFCKRYDGRFPRTCKLLAEVDNTRQSVGLGALRRAITDDVHELPKNVLLDVYKHFSVNEKTWAVCALDIGYAIMTGLPDEPAIYPLLKQDDSNSGKANGPKPTRLRRYRMKLPEGHSGRSETSPFLAICEPYWAKLDAAASDIEFVHTAMHRVKDATGPDLILTAVRTRQALESSTPDQIQRQDEIAAHWDALVVASRRSAHAQDPTARMDEIAKLVRATFGIISSAIDDTTLHTGLREVEPIVAAALQRDWIGMLSAMATADQLGELLLCDKTDSDTQDTNTCVAAAKWRSVLTLTADVATADSSEGVSNALERFAAPVGSWRRKFDRGSVYLNGLAGLKAGIEGAKDFDPGFTAAPLLATGLELNLPVGDTGRIGFVLQILDVGNVASVRFDEVTVGPEIDFVNLFSPGVFVLATPFRAPFVIGAGVNWVPRLRAGPTDDAAVSVWQAGLLLAVDVPLLEVGSW